MNSVTCQVSVYFQIDNFWMCYQNAIDAGDFAIAGDLATWQLGILAIQSLI